jgi:hypothetical protein
MLRAHLATLSLLLLLLLSPGTHAQGTIDNRDVVGEFLLLLLGSEEGKRQALDYVDEHWQPGFTPMLLEVLTFNSDMAFAPALVEVLEDKTGRSFGFNIAQWQQWLWNQKPAFHPAYPEFKSALYGLIDVNFEAYFGADRYAAIRLDEVIWGGVEQDGIPPDDNIVFGLEVNGDARAYPRRILGWHEMFVDERLPAAYPGLARDVRGRGGRHSRGGGLLYPLRHHDPVPDPGRRGEPRVGHQRFSLPFQQVDVRSRH